jgi:hypothetical protein
VREGKINFGSHVDQDRVAQSDHVKTSPMRQAQKWISHAKDFAGLRCAADDFFFSLEL